MSGSLLLLNRRGLSIPANQLKVWVRAASGLFQDTGPLTPAAAASDPIGRASDRSGLGNNLTQPAANVAALQFPTCMNQPAIRFDGTNDCLRSAANVLGTVSALTVAVAGRTRNLTPTLAYFLAASNDGLYSTKDLFGLGFINSTGRKWFAQVFKTGGVNPSLTGPAADTNPHVFVMRWTAGGTLRLTIDGTAATGSPATDSSGTSLALADRVEMGSAKDGTAAIGALDVYQAAIWTTDISDAQAAAVLATLQREHRIYPTVSVTAFTGVLGFTYGAVLKLASGRLLLALTDSTSDGSADGKAFTATSDDAGATWSAATLRASDATYACQVGGPGAIQLASGTILVPFTKYDTGASHAHSTHILVSTDNAATFPTTYDIAWPSGYTWAQVYGRIIETTPGGTLYMPAFGLKTSSSRKDSLLLQSVDAGVTWTLKSVIAAGDATPHDYTETAVTRTGASRYLAAFRDDNGPQLYTATSSDNGATWSAPAAFPNTDKNVTPDLLYMSDGVLVLAVTDRTITTSVYLWRSVDNGATWSSSGYQAAASQYGNPSMVEMSPDGKIGVAYSTASAAAIKFDQFGEANLP